MHNVHVLSWLEECVLAIGDRSVEKAKIVPGLYEPSVLQAGVGSRFLPNDKLSTTPYYLFPPLTYR